MTVRLVPTPLKNIPLRGARLGFDVLAVTVRSLAGVSASLTMKTSGPVVLLTLIVRLVIAVIVGRVFWAGTDPGVRPNETNRARQHFLNDLRIILKL